MISWEGNLNESRAAFGKKRCPSHPVPSRQTLGKEPCLSHPVPWRQTAHPPNDALRCTRRSKDQVASARSGEHSERGTPCAQRQAPILREGASSTVDTRKRRPAMRGKLWSSPLRILSKVEELVCVLFRWDKIRTIENVSIVLECVITLMFSKSFSPSFFLGSLWFLLPPLLELLFPKRPSVPHVSSLPHKRPSPVKRSRRRQDLGLQGSFYHTTRIEGEL
jgi:hypothetical protein